MAGRLRSLALSAALSGSLLAAAPSEAQLAETRPPESPAAAGAWRALFEADLAYLETLIRRDYIYANYPAGSGFEGLLQTNLRQAREEAPRVRDFGSYRAVMQHFIVSFGDAHFSGYFTLSSRAARWPGFTARYRAGRYLVDRSVLPDVRAGDAIESCDGRSIDAWMDDLARFYGGPRGRETTRAAIAEQFLWDRANPLYALPQTCRIAGRAVSLAWRSAPADASEAPQRTSAAAATLADNALASSDFSPNAAWVRIGTMGASNATQARAFQDLIDAAPGLRGRDLIVIDVRGNGGGPYNWFMGYLRGLYGAAYADHFARARLEITNVMLSPPGQSADAGGGFSAEARAIRPPPDPPLDAALAAPTSVRDLPGGGRLTVLPTPVKAIRYPAEPPPNPVRARVYVLADYGCGSACIAFVDEMMRFPGVTLLGTETHIDRRSGGYPGGFELPSGLTVARMGRMVRDGRARGENEAWLPGAENRFSGDIADTEAVKRWIVEVVWPRDVARGATWRQTAILKGPE